MNNVDHAEVAKFNDIANRWWDLAGEFKSLHDINPLRVDYIATRAKLAGMNTIDVGCGGGILTEALAKAGANMTGIDASDAAINTARLHALESQLTIDYQHTYAEPWAAQHPAHYDVVCSLEMLEHVPDPASVVQACAKLAKPGAQLFFSTINRNPKSYAMIILGAEYVMQMVPKGTHDYKKFIRPSELAQWVRDAGLQLQDISGMTYNPLSQTYSINHDTDVNYLIHAIKPE